MTGFQVKVVMYKDRGQSKLVQLMLAAAQHAIGRSCTGHAPVMSGNWVDPDRIVCEQDEYHPSAIPLQTVAEAGSRKCQTQE